jgi:hypothetical protein
MAAVSRLARRPPGLRQSRFARLLPGSAASVRRRRGDDARADRPLCRLAAGHRHPVPSLRQSRHPCPARALRRTAPAGRGCPGVCAPGPCRAAQQHPPHHGATPGRVLPRRQPSVAVARAELSVPGFQAGGQRLDCGQPRGSHAPRRPAAGQGQRARDLARRRLSIEGMDGGRSDQLGVGADRSAPADRRLSCPPL